MATGGVAQDVPSLPAGVENSKFGARTANQQGGLTKILWCQDRFVALGEPFFAALRGMGVDGVNRTAGADPAMLGPAGLTYYVDQPSGKGVLELRDATVEPLRRGYERDRDPRLLIRPSCLSDHAVLAGASSQAARLLKGLLESNAEPEFSPAFIALSDEPSFTTHANPLDFCVGPHCVSAFQRFVERRYETLEVINRVYGATFTAMTDVVPTSTDRVRRRELGGVGWPANLADWNDHLEFCDRTFANAIRVLARDAKQHAHGVPVGLTGLQPPAPFGGNDYARFLGDLEIFEAYDIGGARELARSLAPDARELVTLFPPQNLQPGKGASPRSAVRASLGEALAGGVDAVVVWSAEDCLRAKQVEGEQPVVERTLYGEAVAAGFADLANVARHFAGAAVQRSPVWILESQASVRAWWMHDSRDDGPTWIRRLTSYEAAHSTSMAARESWIRLIQDLGLQPKLVAEADLARELTAARRQRQGPDVLILPRDHCTREQERPGDSSLRGTGRHGAVRSLAGTVRRTPRAARAASP